MVNEQCKALEINFKSAGTQHRLQYPSAKFVARRQSTKEEMGKQACEIKGQACKKEGQAGKLQSAAPINLIIAGLAINLVGVFFT
jgi:hypothetical protein